MWEGDFGLFWGVGAMTGRCPTVAVVGAGMSGMCVAITLLSAGITDVCIYEKADDVGGTWRDNTYPGLTCDVPSRLYQYSFAKNPNWTQMFSRGGEIQDYLRGIAERYGLRHRIRFGATVVSARFDDGRWVLRTDSGTESTVGLLDFGHRRFTSSPNTADRWFGRLQGDGVSLGSLGSHGSAAGTPNRGDRYRVHGRTTRLRPGWGRG